MRPTIITTIKDSVPDDHQPPAAPGTHLQCDGVERVAHASEQVLHASLGARGAQNRGCRGLLGAAPLLQPHPEGIQGLSSTYANHAADGTCSTQQLAVVGRPAVLVCSLPPASACQSPRISQLPTCNEVLGGMANGWDLCGADAGLKPQQFCCLCHTLHAEHCGAVSILMQVPGIFGRLWSSSGPIDLPASSDSWG